MNALQKEPRTGNDHRQTSNVVAPPVNIFENKDAYIMEAEMPGVSKEGLQVTLEGNEVTILGRRSEEKLPGQALFRESHVANFQRVFQLDPVIDTSKISARMEQGLLTLTLPKSEEVKPRKITVGD